MWNKPSEKWLATIPAPYSTEEQKNKLVYMHFFFGGSDWYAIEYNPKERRFFGYVILNGDIQNAEWGYFSFDDLIDFKTEFGFQIDCDTAYYKNPQFIRDILNLKHLNN